MALKDSKMCKQGITSMIPQKLEIIRRLKSGKKQRLWCHMLDRELSMIQRNGRTNNNHLQH
jgi:hypothetical protein